MIHCVMTSDFAAEALWVWVLLLCAVYCRSVLVRMWRVALAAFGVWWAEPEV